MKRYFILLLILLIATFVIFKKTVKAMQSKITDQEIILRADRARGGSVEGIHWNIKIESIEKGRKDTTTYMAKTHEFKTLVEYESPPKLKGRKILMIDRNMWFIKPSLRKPIPISPRQKLMGGASYGDLASTNYAGDYSIKSADEDSVNGEPCYLYELKAIDGKKVTYDKIRYWISKERFIGVKAEFYTISGKMLKWATFEYDNSIMIGNNPQPFISKMIIMDETLKDDITTLIYSDIKIRKIPDSTFNLNLLIN